MNKSDLGKMAREAIALGQPKDQSYETQNIFPQRTIILEGGETKVEALRYCPEMEPTTIPVKSPTVVKMVRLYHPCNKECRLYSEDREKDGGNPCQLAIK